MKVERCAVCATTIHDGDDVTCRHGRAFCLACDERDGCEECNTEWLATWESAMTYGDDPHLWPADAVDALRDALPNPLLKDA